MAFKRDKRVKRVSFLPKTKLNEGFKREKFCVGCKSPITPGLCRTGSIIQGMGFATKRGTESTPILGVMETWQGSYILGGQEVDTVKRVSYYRREKGFLCDECASNYKTLKIPQKDGSVRIEPIVKIDPLPGTILRGAYRNNKGQIIRDGDRLFIPTHEHSPVAVKDSGKRASLIPSVKL